MGSTLTQWFSFSGVQEVYQTRVEEGLLPVWYSLVGDEEEEQVCLFSSGTDHD